MRLETTIVGVLLFSSAAYAQSAPCAPQAYTYDPYKPSDLAIVREYAGVVLAQAPLSTLLRLDPYVPWEGELLRQVGRGIPIWPAYPGYSYPQPSSPVDCRPAPESPAANLPAPSAAPVTRFADMLSALDPKRTTTATTAAVTRRPGGTQAERTRGVSIFYGGRTWASAGTAVPFDESEFVRVGDSGGFSIFRRTGAKDDLIYVPTTPGVVAPFRAMP